MESQQELDNGIPINTPNQKANQKVIKKFFDKYKTYKLSKEYKRYIKDIKDKKDIFSKQSLEPTLSYIKKNEIINKNKCFLDADKNTKNYFPLVYFPLKNNKNDYIKKKKVEYVEENINELIANAIVGWIEIENIISNIKSRWIMNVDGKDLIFSSSFELFNFMTTSILSQNKFLDNYIIYSYNVENQQYSREYKGGDLYFNLMKYLPLYFQKNNINVNNAIAYNVYNNNLDNINNNDNGQETSENNYFIENYIMNSNNDINFGINNF